jgi:hypothetical protein
VNLYISWDINFTPIFKLFLVCHPFYLTRCCCQPFSISPTISALFTSHLTIMTPWPLPLPLLLLSPYPSNPTCVSRMIFINCHDFSCSNLLKTLHDPIKPRSLHLISAFPVQNFLSLHNRDPRHYHFSHINANLLAWVHPILLSLLSSIWTLSFLLILFNISSQGLAV